MAGGCWRNCGAMKRKKTKEENAQDLRLEILALLVGVAWGFALAFHVYLNPKNPLPPSGWDQPCDASICIS
jgi:hypothetical protein